MTMQIVMTRTFIIESDEVDSREEFLKLFWDVQTAAGETDEIIQELFPDAADATAWDAISEEIKFQAVVDWLGYQFSGGDMLGWGCELPTHAVIAEMYRVKK